MRWKIRHEGSSRQVENLTPAEIVEGLQDGVWEPTDEVMGPDDADWVALENHPRFAETALEMETSPLARPDDETRLDMTALIDVTLVLLIFFILATTYQTLERILEMPGSREESTGAIRQVHPEEVEQFMIQVKVRRHGDRPIYWVESKQVDEAALADELIRYVRISPRNELLLDAQGVDYGTVIKVIDAAGGARIAKVHFQTGPR